MYVYLTKLPVLGCASGTRLSYLTSLKEVIETAVCSFQKSKPCYFRQVMHSVSVIQAPTEEKGHEIFA